MRRLFKFLRRWKARDVHLMLEVGRGNYETVEAVTQLLMKLVDGNPGLKAEAKIVLN